jgi:hypothetical protein
LSPTAERHDVDVAAMPTALETTRPVARPPRADDVPALLALHALHRLYRRRRPAAG